MKLILKSFFLHVFPFGWFYSFGGAIIFWSSMISIYPILKYKINISTGIIYRIGLPHDQSYTDGGNTCYNTVYIKMIDSKIFGAVENCEYVSDKDIGKKVELKFIDIPKNKISGFNKILTVDNNNINNFFGQTELMTLVLFLWGTLFLYIAYKDIKNEYKRQLESEEKRKNQPPSTINFDKFN